jgi:hypothetical protein
MYKCGKATDARTDERKDENDARTDGIETITLTRGRTNVYLRGTRGRTETLIRGDARTDGSGKRADGRKAENARTDETENYATRICTRQVLRDGLAGFGALFTILPVKDDQLSGLNIARSANLLGRAGVRAGTAGSSVRVYGSVRCFGRDATRCG